MLVLAAPKLKVPMEGKPRDYITDTPPEGEQGYTVIDSPYYLRRVAEGDLVMVPATPGTVSPAEEVAEPVKKAKE